MPTQTKLTQEMINIICQKVKLRMKQKQIALLVGIDPVTLSRWIGNGKKAQSGLQKQLVDRMAEAEAELYESLVEVVEDRALHGSTTVTERVICLADGTETTQTTTKIEGADAAYALKLLALMDPSRWQTTQQIKIDWQKPVEELGLNVPQVQQAFFLYLESHQEKIGTGAIPIPDVSGKSV